MFVWKNASGEMRYSRPPSSSRSCGAPARWSVSPPAVVSPTPAIRVLMSPEPDAAWYDASLAGPELILPVAGTAALIAAGTVPPQVALPGAAQPLTWAPMVWVGDRSYSLYLWHWPIRMMHWAAALSILVLIWTGFTVGRPYFLPPADLRKALCDLAQQAVRGVRASGREATPTHRPGQQPLRHVGVVLEDARVTSGPAAHRRPQQPPVAILHEILGIHDRHRDQPAIARMHHQPLGRIARGVIA